MSYAALPILRTPRLTLRPLTSLDADAVVDGIGNYDVSRWLGRVPYPYGRSDYDEFFQRVIRENLMIWGIQHNNALIGAVGLDEELGYWLARPFWGQGYGFEAAVAAVSHWFSDRRNGDLASGHYDDNHRSRRLLQALGFRSLGQSPRYARSLAQEVSGTDVVLTRADWQARQDFTLKTPRLTLRPINDSDAADFAALTMPEALRLVSDLKPQMTRPEALAEIGHLKWQGYPGFLLALERQGRMAGTLGFAEGRINHALLPEFRGQGLTGEALSAFLPEIFRRFPVNSIEARHFEDMPDSGAILRKLGFTETGRDIGTSLARLEPATLITYALLQGNLRDRA